jgi:hypothetical protein
MPPALVAVLVLGWLERLWFPTPASAPSARIDTRLPADPGPTLEQGDVLIAQDRAPEPVVRPAESLSASAEALAAVDDDSLFGRQEQPAWIQTLLTLRSVDPRGLRAAAAPVTFPELVGQPQSFRGRAVRFGGTLRGLERRPAPANDYGFDHYWQAWIEPGDGAAAPIMVHALEVPAGLEEGMKLDQPVEIVGYFLKNTAYQARDRQMRRAPMVLAVTLDLRPRAAVVTDRSAWLVSLVFATLAVAAVVAVLGLGLAASGGRSRRPQPAADIDSALAGAEILSPIEALQQLEAADRIASPPTAEHTP